MATIQTQEDRQLLMREWTHQRYKISTNPALIPLDQLNDILQSEEFHWASPLPMDQLERLVHNSLCFAMYDNNADERLETESAPAERSLIGFARWIWDQVSVAYLTDVYIAPEYRGKRLGVWMMECIDEMFRSMPHLRGMILIADRGSTVETFYRRHLAMHDLEPPSFCMDRKGRGTAY